MAGLKLIDVSKKYGQTTAVKNFNLEIKDKEFLVLVGPSGCGKSTMLLIIAGLLEATEGQIFIGDRQVDDVPAKDRNISMVFQNYALYPHMDVYGNMAFGLRVRKFPKEEIDRRVKETAAMLGLENYLDRRPSKLSGGERQRVALGRAIVRDPQVFLMDEPLSNLDAKLRVQMRAEIIKLHQRLQTTIIYVTHDQTEAMTMADRIVILKDGIIQQVGKPKDVYENPTNLFVAGFIGSPSMNFFEGEFLQEGENVYFLAGNSKFKIDCQKLPQNYNNRKVIFGIRPEHIHLEDQSKSGSENVFEAYVDIAEFTSAETYLYCNLNDNTFTTKTSSDLLIESGEGKVFTFNMKRAYFFDYESGERILLNSQ